MSSILSGIRSAALPVAQRPQSIKSAKSPNSDPTPKPAESVQSTRESLSASFAALDQAVQTGDLDSVRKAFSSLQQELKSFYHLPAWNEVVPPRSGTPGTPLNISA